jgi:hypothetical protein
MPWQLSDIRKKVRELTGRLSANNLSNNVLDFNINNYYQYTFPAETKLEREHTFYEFNTVANQQQYTFPNTTYTNVEPTLWLDEMPLLWYQEPNSFFQQNPQQIYRTTPWSGDGTTLAFNTTIQTPPILPGSVIVTDNTATATDNSSGVLNGTGIAGTVNYTTGAISVTFTSAPADGQNIYLSLIVYTANRPNSVMLYNNVFWFTPIPDTVYRCRIKAYRIESPMTESTDTPRLEEWGEAIAYGSARQICASFGEIDRYRELTALYKEQVTYIERRTHQNLLNIRAKPMF